MTVGKGKVSEIKEDKSDTSGLDWTTSLQVTGTGTADVSLHLITKLYGCTGVDMGIGVQGKTTGEVKLSGKPDHWRICWQIRTVNCTEN